MHIIDIKGYILARTKNPMEFFVLQKIHTGYAETLWLPVAGGVNIPVLVFLN